MNLTAIITQNCDGFVVIIRDSGKAIHGQTFPTLEAARNCASGWKADIEREELVQSFTPRANKLYELLDDRAELVDDDSLYELLD